MKARSARRTALLAGRLVVVTAMLVLAGNAVAGAGMPPRAEETAAPFCYAGNWKTWSSSSLSGGSYAYCGEPGGAVTITFEGTWCDVLVRKGPEFGIATVQIDGGPEVTYDLYSATTEYQQPLMNTGTLSEGRHTIRLAYTGTKRTEATGAFINVDAIELADAAAPNVTYHVTEQQDAALLAYRGAWSSWSNGALSGGSYAYTNSLHAGMRIEFYGTDVRERLDVMARTGPEFGYAKVTLDNGEPHYIDLYSATTQYNKRVYTTWAVSPGEHSLVIEWSGRKNPASSGTFINVDSVGLYFAELHRAPVRLEQTGVEFETQGAWSTWSNPALSGGSYLYTNAPGGSVSVSYQGWHGELVARTGPEFGMAEVRVDGVLEDTIDLYSPTPQYGRTVFTTDSLPLELGWHTITLTRTGDKNAQATGTYINIDAADCQAFKAPEYAGWHWLEQQNSNYVTSNGGWSSWANPAFSGGGYAFVNRPASKTIVYNAGRCDILARRGPEFGYAKVTLDGVSHLVDLYSPVNVWSEQVFSTWDTGGGTHTLTVEWTGLKNPAASGTYVNVDAFDMNGYPNTYLRLEQNDDRVAFSGPWSTWSNAMLSGGSYAYTNTPGASCTLSTYGYSFDLIGRVGPEFGAVYVSIDGGTPQEVSMYSPTTYYNFAVWNSGYISPGVHTITVTCAGKRGSGAPPSAGTYANVDGFQVVIGAAD